MKKQLLCQSAPVAAKEGQPLSNKDLERPEPRSAAGPNTSGNRRFLLAVGLFCLLVMAALPARATDPVEGKIWDALGYLNSVPEIAWVEVEGRTVILGWKGYPSRFSRMNQVAARKASRNAGGEIRVFSVKDTLRGWRPSDSEEETKNYLCQTTAQNGNLLRTNCK